MAQHGPQRDPKGLQEGSKRGPQTAPKQGSHPTCLRDPSRTLPGPSRTPPGPLQGAILRLIWPLKTGPRKARPHNLPQQLQNGPLVDPMHRHTRNPALVRRLEGGNLPCKVWSESFSHVGFITRSLTLPP